MSKIIGASIDLSKINESRVVRTDKNGNPFNNGAQYYNITIMVNDEKDKFGNDVAISEGQTAEERASKTTKKFLGNGKVVWESASSQKAPEQPVNQQPSTPSNGLPF